MTVERTPTQSLRHSAEATAGAPRPIRPIEVSVADVLRQVDSTMHMRSGEWLQAAIDAGQGLDIIDLRAEAAYRKGHIQGSVRVALSELPDRVEAFASRAHDVVCVCNGSVQSAMAVVYLRTIGFERAFNLSGGLSAWERQGRPLEVSLGAD